MKWPMLWGWAGILAAVWAEPVKFEPGELDFGPQGQGVHLEAEVTMTNTTASAIQVLNVSSDCSCTAGEPRLRRLAAGESTIIPVGMDTRTYQGAVERRLVVNTSAGSAVLRVKATIRAYAQWEVTPMPVTLPTSLRRQEVLTQVTVTHVGPGDYAVVAAESDQPWLQARLSSTPAGKGQQVEVRKLPAAPVGAHLAQITLRTSDPAQPHLILKVVASVVSPVRVSPNPVILPTVPVGMTATREIVVSGWEETSAPLARLAAGRVDVGGRQANGDYLVSVAVTPETAGIHSFQLQLAIDEGNVLATVPVILKAEAKR